MQIGNYKLSFIDSGRFRLDGGAMFGVVPKVLWESKKPPDHKNRIQMSANLLLLQNNDHKVLIDTGLGDKFDQKLANIYAIDYSERHLTKSLNRLNLNPEDITDVILTHLHFDHAGGATFCDSYGDIKPTFPNARYFVQKRQFEWAMQPSEKDQASFFYENYLPLQKSNQLILLEGSDEILPGIEVLPIEGHTVAQQMALIRDKNKSLLFAADLIPTAAHIPVPWIMAYDLYPLTAIEEKKRYLKSAVEQEWLVFFEHDPEIHCATIKMTEKKFVIKETIDLLK